METYISRYGILSLCFLLIVLICKMLQRWLRHRQCSSTARLDGKTVIITGGNSGIGKETAKDLARRGARVIIACRDTGKSSSAAKEIKTKVPSAVVIVKALDLSSFSSIHEFVEDIKATEKYVHILINNAGISGTLKSMTEDGFELQFGVNHLGHFLLTQLLLDKIKKSAPARIINVSSILHHFGIINFDDINTDKNYNPIKPYCNSKLAGILFARELAKHLSGTGVTAYSLHPGYVNTDLSKQLSKSISRLLYPSNAVFRWLFYADAEMGAQTTIYCAVEESLAEESGYYYSYCRRTEPSVKAKNDEVASRLWDVSMQLVGLSS